MNKFSKEQENLENGDIEHEIFEKIIDIKKSIDLSWHVLVDWVKRCVFWSMIITIDESKNVIDVFLPENWIFQFNLNSDWTCKDAFVERFVLARMQEKTLDRRPKSIKFTVNDLWEINKSLEWIQRVKMENPPRLSHINNTVWNDIKDIITRKFTRSDIQEMMNNGEPIPMKLDKPNQVALEWHKDLWISEEDFIYNIDYYVHGDPYQEPN